MTDYLVRLSQHSPGAPASGWVPADEVAVTGSILCRPYAPDINAARVHAEGPDRIILPEAFSVRLVNGECTLPLRPTDAWWCWEIREQTKGGRIRHLSVADSALVLDYADAVDVDPTTLTPAASAVPAWTAATLAVQGYAHAAALSETAAETAQGLAEDARDAAAQSALDALGSKNAAAGSAGDSATSAGESLGSAGLADGYADAAGLSAGAAAQSASDANGSAVAAAGSAGAASGSAGAAAGSAGAASSSAADALASKNAAGVSEGNAAGSAAAAAATLAGAVPKSLIDAKGDLLVGSANDTVVRLPVGSTGALLTPDSTAGSGLRWTTRLTLEGSGSPLGVVSAPVGSVYYDTAGTCGAWEWIKTTGTGNTGWVVIIGNTGWRDVSSLLVSGLAVSSLLGRARIRRINNYVEFDFKVDVSAGSITTILSSISTGFSPEGGAPFDSGVFIATSSGAGASAMLLAQRIGVLYNSGEPYRTGALTPWPNPGTVAWTGRHFTSSAWPTSLPGTAA